MRTSECIFFLKRRITTRTYALIYMREKGAGDEGDW